MKMLHKKKVWINTHNGVGPYKKWTVSTARNGMIKYNNAIRKIAVQTDTPFVDLDSKIPKTLEYLSDDCHYRSPAINLISDEISKTILKTFFRKDMVRSFE